MGVLRPVLRPVLRGVLRSPFNSKWSNGLSDEANALIARFSSQPTDSRKTLINDTIVDLKDAGIWAKLDLLYLLAAHDAQAARQNWIGNVYNLTATNSPTFTTDRGYAGDGVAARLDVPGAWTPVQMAQDSALFGGFTRQAASYDGSTPRLGIYTGAGRLSRRANAESNVEWRINDGTSASTGLGGVGGANQTGHFAARRTASNERSVWRNGAQIATNTQASVVNSSVFHLFNANGTGFSDQQFSFAYAGASLTDQQMADMNTILSAYLIAVGAI